MKKVLLSLVIIISLTACTDNYMAKKMGGTETVKLKPNEKLINATWKEESLWLLVEDTLTKQRQFREKSSFGMVEGKIVFE